MKIEAKGLKVTVNMKINGKADKIEFSEHVQRPHYRQNNDDFKTQDIGFNFDRDYTLEAETINSEMDIAELLNVFKENVVTDVTRQVVDKIKHKEDEKPEVEHDTHHETNFKEVETPTKDDKQSSDKQLREDNRQLKETLMTIINSLRQNPEVVSNLPNDELDKLKELAKPWGDEL